MLGEALLQPRRTRKMLLLSPALIWHWLPAEGGPEAAAAARPRPPGIFERCSWVPGGWQTWQRRVGRTPEPTTRRGRQGGARVGEGGGSRRGWPLSGWPEEDGGAGPAQAQPRRQPSPWPGGAALGAMLLPSPGGPGPLRA